MNIKKGIVLLMMVLLAGCTSNPITFKESDLATTLEAVKTSEIMIIHHDTDTKAITELPAIDLTLEKTDITLESKNPVYSIRGTKDKDQYMIELYQEKEDYYIVTYSYSVKEDGKTMYTPIGYDKETIYQANEEVYHQFVQAMNE